MTVLPEVLEKLEPCPFCGNDVNDDEGCFQAGGFRSPSTPHWVVRCGNPSCNAETSAVNRTDAITAWNTRPALLASQQYAEANPLGGPASMLETAARRIRAGEDFHEVLADYDLHSGAALLRGAGDAARYRWLRAEHAVNSPLAHVCWKQNDDRECGEWVNTASPESLDAAIDAAMHAPGGAGGGDV